MMMMIMVVVAGSSEDRQAFALPQRTHCGAMLCDAIRYDADTVRCLSRCLLDQRRFALRAILKPLLSTFKAFKINRYPLEMCNCSLSYFGEPQE